MKRFVDTNDWRDLWYRKLSPQAKHLRRYLWDNCDCAGVIAVDFEAITFHVGEAIEEQHLAELGDWAERLPDGRLLIPSFIHFQCGTLSSDCRGHSSVIKAVEQHRLVAHGILYHHSTDSLSSPPEEPLQEKYKEKEQEQDHYKTFPPNLRTPAFVGAWREWEQYRRERKNRLTPTTVQHQLKYLSAQGEADAIATIRHTITKGWQGLVNPKGDANGQATLKPTAPAKPILKIKRL